MSKRHLVVLIGVATLFMAGVAVAQEAPAPSPAEKIDVQKAQQELAPLAKAFGVKTPATDTASSPEGKEEVEAVPQDKDMADVADRELDMVESVTVSISNTLKTMAPEVWRIMIRQQYAKAIAGPFGALGWIFAAFVLWKFGGKVWPASTVQEDDDIDVKELKQVNNTARIVVLKAIPIATFTIASLFLFGALRNSILYLVNPEYYAIRDLLQAIMEAKASVT